MNIQPWKNRAGEVNFLFSDGERVREGEGVFLAQLWKANFATLSRPRCFGRYFEFGPRSYYGATICTEFIQRGCASEKRIDFGTELRKRAVDFVLKIQYRSREGGERGEDTFKMEIEYPFFSNRSPPPMRINERRKRERERERREQGRRPRLRKIWRIFRLYEWRGGARYKWILIVLSITNSKVLSKTFQLIPNDLAELIKYCSLIISLIIYWNLFIISY